MWGRDHYKPYDACVRIETDESDLPSKGTPDAAARRLLEEKKKVDSAKGEQVCSLWLVACSLQLVACSL